MKDYLAEILEVNNMSISELKKAAKTQIRPHRGKENNSRERFIFALSKNGLKIPYHYRPVCVVCGIHFKPIRFRQNRCHECSPILSSEVTLTPEDCLELGLKWDKANQHLELPESYREVYEAGLVNRLNTLD